VTDDRQTGRQTTLLDVTIGGHSQSQLHTPGTHYRLTADLVTLYTPLKTPQSTPVQTVLTYM